MTNPAQTLLEVADIEAIYGDAVLALRDLSPARRDIWKTMFDYYAFASHGDPVAHLAPADRGALGPLTPEQLGQARRRLVERLSRRWTP